MNIDFNEICDKLTSDPWDLSVTFDGQTFAIRPLTNLDLQALNNAIRSTAETRSEQLMGAIDGLFSGVKPAFAGAEASERISVVVMACTMYLSSRAKKKSEAIGAVIARKMGVMTGAR